MKKASAGSGVLPPPLRGFIRLIPHILGNGNKGKSTTTGRAGGLRRPPGRGLGLVEVELHLLYIHLILLFDIFADLLFVQPYCADIIAANPKMFPFAPMTGKLTMQPDGTLAF